MTLSIYISIPLVCLLFSQIIKFIIESTIEKKIVLNRLFCGAGGFPSTHTSLICGLLFSIMYSLGIDSVEFGIVFIVAIIILYDAVGVRREVEKSNRIINDLLLKSDDKSLKHDVGHSPIEIIAGIILAFIVATILFYFF